MTSTAKHCGIKSLYLWIILFQFHSNVTSSTAADTANEGRGALIEEGEWTSRVPEIDCRSFITLTNMTTYDGDFRLLAGRGYRLTPDGCRRACLRQHPRHYCIAAQHIRATASCLIVGYKLHRKPGTSHFRRLCNEGRGCFKQYDGWNTHFHTGYIAVPELPRYSVRVIADYCREHCESMEHCVGFDVTLRSSFCPYFEIRLISIANSTIYRRQCQKHGVS